MNMMMVIDVGEFDVDDDDHHHVGNFF